MGVLYTQALADRATAWLARPLTNSPEGKRSAEGLLELATIWAAINQVGLPECLRQCQYSERAAALRSYLTEFSRQLLFPDAMSDTPQSKYQIAPAFAGQSFVDEGLSGPVTAENLTDEAAEYFIGKGRGDAFILRDAAQAKPAGEAPSATDHAKELEAEQKAHTATSGKLQKEQEAHTKTNEALKSEKEAHKATKKELTEVQKQLADAQKQLAKLAEKAQEAADQSNAGTDATA